MSVFREQGDGYDLEFDSSDDVDSSDDEANKPVQFFNPPLLEEDGESSSDNFEKELEAELNDTVHALEEKRQKSAEASSSNATGTSASTSATKTEADFYDDDYFDSDDSEEGDDMNKTEGASPSKKKHPVLSNEDLYYDPNIDDDNQKWMDDQRAKGARSRKPAQGQSKVKVANKSDAILDCPACMTTVCIDCQRHEFYHHQFRAMFVQNCRVDQDHVINAPVQASRHRKRKHGRAPDPSALPGGQTEGDEFHAVKCQECDTLLGARDKEEVYYFYNVLPGHT